jgi:hypothetical protein
LSAAWAATPGGDRGLRIATALRVLQHVAHVAPPESRAAVAALGDEVARAANAVVLRNEARGPEALLEVGGLAGALLATMTPPPPLCIIVGGASDTAELRSAVTDELAVTNRPVTAVRFATAAGIGAATDVAGGMAPRFVEDTARQLPDAAASLAWAVVIRGGSVVLATSDVADLVSCVFPAP